MSPDVDPLAPWIGARGHRQRALAATFLVSLGGLSGMLHAAAICSALIATLLPLPFVPLACSPVKRVSFAPPERVEMSIVKVEPPPILEEIPPPPPVEEIAPAAPKGAKAKKLQEALLVQEVGMLAILGSAPSSSGVLGSLDSAGEGAVFGALIGDEIGDSFGTGGLGLSGIGVAGGVEGGLAGGTAVGLGGIGTIGHGGGGTGSGYGSGYGSGSLGDLGSHQVRLDVVDTDLDRVLARRALQRRITALAACEHELPVDLTLRVRDGAVSAVEGAPACIAGKLAGMALPGSGYVAVHLAPR